MQCKRLLKLSNLIPVFNNALLSHRNMKMWKFKYFQRKSEALCFSGGESARSRGAALKPLPLNGFPSTRGSDFTSASRSSSPSDHTLLGRGRWPHLDRCSNRRCSRGQSPRQLNMRREQWKHAAITFWASQNCIRVFCFRKNNEQLRITLKNYTQILQSKTTLKYYTQNVHLRTTVKM